MKKLFISLILVFSFVSLAWGGILFDGVDDKISIPTSTSIKSPDTAVTLAVMVNITGGEQYSPAIAVPIVGSPYVTYKISLNESGANTRNTQFFLAINGTLRSTTSVNLSSGVWYYITGRWASGEKLTMRIYNMESDVLNIYESASTYSGNLTYDSTDRPLEIGGSTSGRTTNGIIATVVVWNSKLTITEIVLLEKGRIKGMPYQIQPANLVGYWPLDDLPDGGNLAGATFVDRSGSGNSGSGSDADASGGQGKAESVLSYP